MTSPAKLVELARIGANELRMARELSPEQTALLIIAMEQVGDLIGDSAGVTGLHLNGDVAEWDWLLDHWLDTFNEAAAPIREMRAARLVELEASKARAWGEHQSALRARAATQGNPHD